MPDGQTSADASHLLAELPGAVRDLVIGHWPRTSVPGMCDNGDHYTRTGRELNTSADQYEALGRTAEQALVGATREGLAQRNSSVVKSMRDQAAVCFSMAQQCYDTADSTLETQHQLIVAGIVLGAQLAYDALLFFQGGGLKALNDRIEAEVAMREIAERLAVRTGQEAAAGAARRAALHGALQAAKIGVFTSAVTSAGAQAWNIADGLQQGFDVGSFGEQVLGGALGGVAGAEVGRRLAPAVLNGLSGRATTVLGRLVTHVGGTVIIGGAGGVVGGVVGVVPSLIIHHGDIHSVGDLFRQVREAAITGFGGGFAGAAFSSLRVHQAGRAATRDGYDTDVAARQREFGARVDALLRSGAIPEVEVIEQPSKPADSARLVERLTFPGGTEVIHKVVTDPQHAHAEYLTSLVGDAVGAEVPAVHVVGRHVYTEVTPGGDAAGISSRGPESVARSVNTPAGVRSGMLDALVHPVDREAGDRLVAPDAAVWATGESPAARSTESANPVIGPLAEHFLRRGPDGAVGWKDHPLTSAEVQEVRARVEQLRPAFTAAGRADWHDVLLHRLDAMADHSVDVVAARRAGGPPPPNRLVYEPVASVRNPDDAGSGGRRGASAGPVRDRPVPAEEGYPGGRASGPVSPKPVDAAAAGGPPEHAPPKSQPPEGDSPPSDPAPSDDSVRDGPPTRPLPRPEPDHGAPEEDPHAPQPEPEPSGMTMAYQHPDDGYVDVVLTGPDSLPMPLRLTPGQQYVLGRGRETFFPTTNEYVSNRHAVITVNDAGRVFIRDENSMNGTFVDGKQLAAGNWVRVYDGQSLMLSRNLEIGLSFERQVAEVRLFGDGGPSLKVSRNQRVPIGRAMVHPDAPRQNTISTVHAVLGMDASGRVYIEDVGSKNGTRVNGEKTTVGRPHYLEPGDQVRFGAYTGEAEFLPPGASREANPVRFLFRGGDGIRLTGRLEPGQWVHIGTEPGSPFAAELQGRSGVAARHAVVGLDYDGRLWIRAEHGSAGVWVNGDRVAPGQRVTIAEGDRVAFGREFAGIAHVGADAHIPPAEIRIGPWREAVYRLEPGDERRIGLSSLHNDEIVLRFGVVDGRSVPVPDPRDEVVVGRDFDGRMWIRDPVPHPSYRVRVGDDLLAAGEKRYLDDGETLTIGRLDAEVKIAGNDPLALRLTDDEHAPPLMIRPGEAIRVGRASDSPLALLLANHPAVQPHHATIYRDTFGDVWLRAELSERGTWVNNQRVDPARPVQLQPGDRLRFADWAGAALFDRGGREMVAQPAIDVRLNSPRGDTPLQLVPGGEPVTLGRSRDALLPTGVANGDELSRRHVTIGAYPSGRIWIRDEGSTNGTHVNGRPIDPHVPVILKPGDHVQLSSDGGYEFTVAYPSAEGDLFLNMMDNTPETVKMVGDLAVVPHRVYARVSEHMNAVPGGGIVIGNRPMLDLPGTESLQGTPYGRKPGTSWNTVRGVYMGGPRRIVINSGGRGGSANVVWHEFGHAADAAYGTGGRWYSDGPEWSALHADILRTLGQHPRWNDYYNKPTEAFAEAFTAWVRGGTTDVRYLRDFALGDNRLADALKDHFDRLFG
ncbi:FHA domain-containing protein [Nocardia sp. alder85J]|uniref:FHA domain-containing protein n=1 Tax=Nocardia sp. alder85J TaxID=2862949 RepID=UPI001CD7C218|nr:FHA domain-containing protein [Nocardia sp. alder85J]MCX4094940.1 FHA domain-containing protein [Nocardia sp. alder85J]